MKRVKELEKQNDRLRKAVSDLTLEKLILKEAASGTSKPHPPPSLRRPCRSEVLRAGALCLHSTVRPSASLRSASGSQPDVRRAPRTSAQSSLYRAPRRSPSHGCSSLLDHDKSVVQPFFANQVEQHGSMLRIEPDTASRRRSSQASSLIRAMDGVVAIIKD